MRKSYGRTRRMTLMKPEKEKKRTLEDHLIEKIKESGYPLEIEVSNILDPDYIVFNTSHYFDADAQQDRDIDIYAIPDENTRVFTDEELEKKMNPFFLRTEVAIECKKSTTHCWIFFTRPFLKPSNLHTSGQYLDKFFQTPVASRVEGLLFDKLFDGKNMRLHYDHFDDVAIACDEIKKQGKPKSRKDIFEGLNQLVKFVCYERGEPEKPDITRPDFQILMFFPIIVFDGDMYKVKLESGEPKMEKTTHILIRKNYRSPYTKQVETFLIDIVHRSHLSEFLKLLDSDFRNMRKAILENHDEFVKKAEENAQEYEGLRKKGFFG